MQMMEYPKKYLAKSILKKYLEDTIFKILFESVLHNTTVRAERECPSNVIHAMTPFSWRAASKQDSWT